MRHAIIMAIVAFIQVVRIQVQAEMTNIVGIEYIDTKFKIDGPAVPDNMFLKRLGQEIMHTEYVFFDDFGPPSEMNWIRLGNREHYGITDSYMHQGAKTFSQSLIIGFRETAVAIVPFEMWAGPFANLFTGSLGNTREERDELSGMYSEGGRSWWQSTRSSGFIQYGIRPWRTSPYAYLRANIGEFQGAPLFSVEGRAYYSFRNAERLTLEFTAPLPDHMRFLTGFSFSPSKISTEDNWSGMTARLERAISRNSYAFIGMRITQSERMILGAGSWDF